MSKSGVSMGIAYFVGAFFILLGYGAYQDSNEGLGFLLVTFGFIVFAAVAGVSILDKHEKNKAKGDD